MCLEERKNESDRVREGAGFGQLREREERSVVLPKKPPSTRSKGGERSSTIHLYFDMLFGILLNN